MLKRAFTSYPELEYIIWSCPSNAMMPDFITKVFTEIDMNFRSEIPKIDPLNGLKFYYIHRYDIIPKLLVRDARVEDNDDLLPILRNSTTYQINESDDEYFLASLIETKNENNR